MLKEGQRVEVIKPKLSWSGKRVMAKVGHKGTVASNQSPILPNDSIRIFLGGQYKGTWILPSHLKRIDE